MKMPWNNFGVVGSWIVRVADLALGAAYIYAHTMSTSHPTSASHQRLQTTNLNNTESKSKLHNWHLNQAAWVSSTESKPFSTLTLPGILVPMLSVLVVPSMSCGVIFAGSAGSRTEAAGIQVYVSIPDHEACWSLDRACDDGLFWSYCE